MIAELGGEAGERVREINLKYDPRLARYKAPQVTLRFGPPMRFMQTEIVVLPLDPHGPLRVFHDRIASCGLPFQRARFTFSPHVTLSLYPTLTREAARDLLAMRVTEPVVIDTV